MRHRRSRPQLKNTPPTPGCGAGKSDGEWISELVALRLRVMALSNFELSAFLELAEYGHLIGLVIAPPYADALLVRFVSLLDTEIATALARDCQMLRQAWPGGDLACATCTYTAGLLELCELPRATPERLAAIRAMALQLAAKPDEKWFRHRSFFLYRLFPLLALTGGLEGALGQRIEILACEEEWRYLEEHYPDNADDPLFEGVAERCVQGLSVLLAGQAWEADSLLGEDELAQAEINALLDSWCGSDKEFATALPYLLQPLDDAQTGRVLAEIGWSGTYSLVRFLARCPDMELVRRVLRNCPDHRQDSLIAALTSWCDSVEQQEKPKRGIRGWLTRRYRTSRRLTTQEAQ